MKPSSFDRYVDAHEWEWKVEIIAFAVLAVVAGVWWLIATIATIRRERANLRKNGLL